MGVLCGGTQWVLGLVCSWIAWLQLGTTAVLQRISEDYGEALLQTIATWLHGNPSSAKVWESSSGESWATPPHSLTVRTLGEKPPNGRSRLEGKKNSGCASQPHSPHSSPSWSAHHWHSASGVPLSKSRTVLWPTSGGLLRFQALFSR